MHINAADYITIFVARLKWDIRNQHKRMACYSIHRACNWVLDDSLDRELVAEARALILKEKQRRKQT